MNEHLPMIEIMAQRLAKILAAYRMWVLIVGPEFAEELLAQEIQDAIG